MPEQQMTRFEVATRTAVLLGALVLGAMTLSSPSVPDDPPATEFSADRAMRHVAAIATTPRPMGSPENESVRDYLAAELSQLGLDPVFHTVTVPDYYVTPGRMVDVTNVMARIPGSSPTTAIGLIAHYDSTPATPGANDNASAVAAILETARALTASAPLGNDVIILFTDGEEPAPRPGSRSFVADHPWATELSFIVNFEALGGSGPSMLVETGQGQLWTVDRVATGTTRPVAFSFLSAIVAELGEIGTDFDAFRNAGVRGAHFAYMRGSSIYHLPGDDVDSVSVSSLQHHGDYALGLARSLGGADLGSVPGSGEALFFTVFPGVLLRYSTGWALPSALVALVAALTAVRANIRRGRRWRQPVARAGWVAVTGLGAAVVGTLAWMGVAAIRPEMGAVEAYVYLAGLIAAGLGVRWLIARRGRDRLPVASGPVLFWALLGVGMAIVMPGASYLFVWPSLVAALALVAVRPISEGRRLGRLAVVSVVTAVMMIPAIETFFMMSGPRPGNLDSEMTEAFALVGLLVVLCVELLMPFLAAGSGRVGPDAGEVPVADDELAAVAA